MKRTRTTFLLLTVMLFLAACHTTRRGEPITGALQISDPRIAQGRLVFLKNCHQCHPGGEAGLGPALNNKPAPVFLMKTQVRVGLGAMPSFSKEAISPEDLDALMAYIIRLRKADRS
jgi:mono/diheme cytochrome c family protein